MSESLALRTARRREVLRLALGSMLGLITIEELGQGLTDVTTAVLSGALALVHRFGDGIEFGIVAMGRYGGAELGFGSDADVMYVYRAAGATDEDRVLDTLDPVAEPALAALLALLVCDLLDSAQLARLMAPFEGVIALAEVTTGAR